MKKLMPFIGAVFCILSTYGQDVSRDAIVSQGDYEEAGDVSVSWTLGEVFYETFTASNSEGLHLTEGNQQAKYIIYAGLSSVEDKSIEMSLYPNPTPDVVYLKTKDLVGASYQLVDISGKLIISKVISDAIESISMGDLPPSTFILKVVQDNTYLKTFKIKKN